MKPLRLGVIGLGQRIAHVLKACVEVRWQFEVTGYVDPQPIGLPILQESGIAPGHSYQTIEAFFADGPFDLVLIGSPNHLHYEHLLSAFEAGFPIFCEKPIVRTEEETLALARHLSAKKTPPLYIGLVMRSMPIVREVTTATYRGSELASELLLRLFRLPFCSPCGCGTVSPCRWARAIQPCKSPRSRWYSAIPKRFVPRCSEGSRCGSRRPIFAGTWISREIFSRPSSSRIICRHCNCPCGEQIAAAATALRLRALNSGRRHRRSSGRPRMDAPSRRTPRRRIAKPFISITTCRMSSTHYGWTVPWCIPAPISSGPASISMRPRRPNSTISAASCGCSPDERFLDIGCGWGALVIHAARRYGVRAHGVTLSPQQLKVAQRTHRRSRPRGPRQRRIAGLPGHAGESVYDKIASIGMFEHVGLKNLPVYFSTVHRLLKPHGLFLNHGITHDSEGWRKSISTEFINRYVFPDGQLDKISNIQHVMETARFEIADVEALRPHYALTLRHWVARLERNHVRALQYRQRSDIPGLASVHVGLRLGIRSRGDRHLPGVGGQAARRQFAAAAHAAGLIRLRPHRLKA